MRLERDVWSIVEWQTQLLHEYHPPPAPLQSAWVSLRGLKITIPPALPQERAPQETQPRCRCARDRQNIRGVSAECMCGTHSFLSKMNSFVNKKRSQGQHPEFRVRGQVL